MKIPTKEERMAALSALVELQTARYRWLETEAANFQALLTEEERLLLQARMMGASLETVGLTMSITRERVRQKEAAALIKLQDIRAAHPIPGWDRVK